MTPTAIRNFNADARLEIDWDDDSTSCYAHELLRVQCPCADCRGHTPEQAKIITGKKDVRVTHIELVGNYAVRIEFDDGHNTGLYTFTHLRHQIL
ncbi:MAG: gamma-butyrobetaine hydroxylase-like domain-containing protein [Mariprofundus sp.]|nr:gamma-butyrobetaine hydroxylase-like domain-containing protein [Mariprofundus sp.]